MENEITKVNHQLVVYTHPTKQTFDSNIEMAVRSMRGEVVMDRRQMNYAAKHFKIDFFETLVEVDKLIETIYGTTGKDNINPNSPDRDVPRQNRRGYCGLAGMPLRNC